MNKENELELVLEQCEEVVNRKIPLLVLAPEYTKILLDYIKELHNKIDKLEDELNWYKQECDDLEMSGGVGE